MIHRVQTVLMIDILIINANQTSISCTGVATERVSFGGGGGG